MDGWDAVGCSPKHAWGHSGRLPANIFGIVPANSAAAQIPEPVPFLNISNLGIPVPVPFPNISNLGIPVPVSFPNISNLGIPYFTLDP